MAEMDPSEKALEDLLAGLAEPKAAEKTPKGEAKSQSTAASRDTVGEKMSEIDEMAAGLEELLSSSAISEQVAAVKAEEDVQAAAEKEDFEDIESALATALSAPGPAAETVEFDKIGEIEEVWEDESAGVSVAPTAMAPTIDFSALAEAPAAGAVEEVVVVEPEKLSEKRKRFFVKTTLGVLAAVLIASLTFYFGIQPALRYYFFIRLKDSVLEKRYIDSDRMLLTSEGFGMTVEKYMVLSDLAMNNRDLPRSLGYANKAYDAAPKHIPTVNRIARIYLMQGRLDEAEKLARQSRTVDPDNLEGYVIQAGAYYKKQEIAKAQKSIADVLARNRDYVPALELQRDIYVDLKNYQLAESIQQQLTLLKKDIPQAQRLMDLGKIYFASGRYAKAVGVLNDAYQKDPALWEAGYFLAKSQAGLGQYVLAAAQISRTLRETPNPTLDMYHLRALANYHRGDIYTAVEELQRIRSINPKYSPLYVLLGKIYIYSYGEYATGLKFLELARELGYDESDIHKPLGEAYFQLKQYGEALAAWNPILLDIEPTDPFLLRISTCLIHMNQMSMAQAILMKMYSAGSRATAIFNNLGVIHEIQGRKDAALRFYFQATEKAILQGLKDSRIPKKNFDRLLGGQAPGDLAESLLLQS